jgi:hypothetical protein
MELAVNLDLDQAINFLTRLRPNGPWLITAIQPDGDAKTRTFKADAITSAEEFIKACNVTERRNIYYSVNPTKKEMRKKAAKGDIAAIEFALADLDPADDETADAAKARYLDQLNGSFKPKPTMVVDSGNGIQALWRLKEPIVLGEFADEDKKIISDVEARIAAIMVALGGTTGTQNIDRVLRLPGTINWPNQAKLRAGRSASVAKLIEANDLIYELKDFPLPESRSSDVAEALRGPRRGLPKILLMMLHIPDGGAGNRCGEYESRSAAFYAFVRQALRLGIIEEEITEVLLDDACRGKAIREHCRENGDEPYLKRQIKKAKEAIATEAEDLIDEMNNKYCVVRIGGRTRVMTFKTEFTRKVPEYLLLEDFKNFLLNRKVVVGKGAPLGHYWLSHPRRRQYEGVVYRPDIQDRVVDGRLNLWQGFATEPRQGDWSLMRNHIKEVLAANNAEIDQYTIRWSAWAVQNPGRRAEVAVVLMGDEGTGKGIYGRTMCGFFGQHSFHASSSDHLTGKHNEHLQDCSLVFADEAWWPGDKAAEGTIKRNITEDTLIIEPKFIGKMTVPNCLKVIIASNNEWTVPAGISARRFVVSKVSDDHRQDRNYFKLLYAELDRGGREAMLHDLLSLDLGDWHPRLIVNTAALIDQKIRSMDIKMRWWLDLLEEGQLPFGCIVDRDCCPSKALYDDHANYVRRSGGRRVDGDNAFGMFLSKVAGPNLRKVKNRGHKVILRGGITTDATGNVYQMPPLKECRERMDKMLSRASDWGGDPDAEWGTPMEPDDRL